MDVYEGSGTVNAKKGMGMPAQPGGAGKLSANSVKLNQDKSTNTGTQPAPANDWMYGGNNISEDTSVDEQETEKLKTETEKETESFSPAAEMPECTSTELELEQSEKDYKNNEEISEADFDNTPEIKKAVKVNVCMKKGKDEETLLDTERGENYWLDVIDANPQLNYYQAEILLCLCTNKDLEKAQKLLKRYCELQAN